MWPCPFLIYTVCCWQLPSGPFLNFQYEFNLPVLYEDTEPHVEPTYILSSQNQFSCGDPHGNAVGELNVVMFFLKMCDLCFYLFIYYVELKDGEWLLLFTEP